MKSPQSRTAAAMLGARDSPLSKRRSHRQGRGRGRRTRGTKMRHDLLPLPSHSAIPPRLGRAVLHNVLVIGGTLALAVVVLDRKGVVSGKGWFGLRNHGGSR